VNQYDKLPQNWNLGKFLLYKRIPHSQRNLIILTLVFNIIFGIITKGYALFFLIPLLTILIVQKIRMKYDRFILTENEIKLLSDKNSSFNKIYPISDISSILIPIRRIILQDQIPIRYSFNIKLDLGNGKTITINFRHFVLDKRSETQFHVRKIYNFCKANYSIPITILNDHLFYTYL
jgi:hypothetical protein